jgi:hypothetical protein
MTSENGTQSNGSNGTNGNNGRAGMIHRVVQMALRQRFLVLMLVGAITIWGAISFQRMPVDAYPDLSPPMVEIITQWPGHAAEEVERLITVPLEVEMNAIDIALRPIGHTAHLQGRYGQLFCPQQCFRALVGRATSNRRHAEPGSVVQPQRTRVPLRS